MTELTLKPGDLFVDKSTHNIYQYLDRAIDIDNTMLFVFRRCISLDDFFLPHSFTLAYIEENFDLIHGE